MRLRPHPDLRIERLGDEVLACVPDHAEVHRLTGPLAAAALDLTDGAGHVDDALAPTLIDLRLAEADEVVDLTDGALSRRRMLLLSGAATIGVATLALPQAAAAASAGGLGGGGGGGGVGEGPVVIVTTTTTTAPTTTTTAAPTTTTTTSAPTTTTTAAPVALSNGGTIRGTGRFTDPNGIVITRTPTQALLDIGANWETATLSGPRNDVLRKNGTSTVGALRRGSNRDIEVNLPVGTTYTLTIVWSGNSRPTTTYVFTA